MDQRRSERRRTLGGAAALLLLPLFLWAGIFADKRWRGWWLALGAFLLLAVVRDLVKEREGHS